MQAAILHQKDLVRSADERGAMRNNDAGYCKTRNKVRKLLLGCLIKVRGPLIKDQKLRLPIESAGKKHALALASR
jgi:hypothetical protein